MSDPCRHPWSVALGGCAALAAAMGIGRFVYTPILPAMADALGWSRSEAGLVAGANFAGYLAGALLAGSSRLTATPRTILMAALATVTLATAAMGLAEAFSAFLVLRAIGGAASAFGLVFASSIVLEALRGVPGDGPPSLHYAGVGFGIMLSAALVPLIGSGPEQWRMLWFGAAACAAVASLAAALLLPSGAALPPGARDEGPARVPFAFVLAYALLGFGYVITATFIVDMVRGEAALRPFETGVWLAFGLAAAPSVAFWSRIGRRTGLLPAYAVAAAVQAAGVLAGVNENSPWALFTASVLLGGTFMGMTALGFGAARALAPAAPRRAVAVMTAAFGFGQMLGPPFAGRIRDATGGFEAASMTAGAGLLLAAGLALGLARRSRTR
jgi:predicted MFS family arabinose efflux permease